MQGIFDVGNTAILQNKVELNACSEYFLSFFLTFIRLKMDEEKVVGFHEMEIDDRLLKVSGISSN